MKATTTHHRDGSVSIRIRPENPDEYHHLNTRLNSRYVNGTWTAKVQRNVLSAAGNRFEGDKAYNNEGIARRITLNPKEE